MTEDKQEICDALLKALQLTRQYDDLQTLQYYVRSNGDELVVAEFEQGVKRINVNMDSGAAMIRDIVSHLG